jgi:soluble lytic murein transglycosylase
MRAANRAGGNAPVIAKACFAVIKKAADAKAQLDGVPAEARRDIGYIFSRAQWLRPEDKATEAVDRTAPGWRDTGPILPAPMPRTPPQ